jgi:hypothetical protein
MEWSTRYYCQCVGTSDFPSLENRRSSSPHRRAKAKDDRSSSGRVSHKLCKRPQKEKDTVQDKSGGNAADGYMAIGHRTIGRVFSLRSLAPVRNRSHQTLAILVSNSRVVPGLCEADRASPQSALVFANEIDSSRTDADPSANYSISKNQKWTTTSHKGMRSRARSSGDRHPFSRFAFAGSTPHISPSSTSSSRQLA